MNEQTKTMVEEALEKDETLAVRLCEAKTTDEVVELFRAIGIEMDAEAADSFLDMVTKDLSGELSEADLEEVSGGFIATATLAGCVIYGVFAGIVIAACCLAAYKIIKYGRCK